MPSRLFLFIILLTAGLGYLYLPIYNYKVVIVIDTLRIDTSLIYLGLILGASLLAFHWLLAGINWLKKAPKRFQHYRQLKRLEKLQLLREEALNYYLEEDYERAESTMKKSQSYAKTKSIIDTLYATKMALLQTQTSRAESMLSTEPTTQHKQATILLQSDIYLQQQAHDLVIAILNQHHIHNRPTQGTSIRLCKAYAAKAQWQDLAKTLPNLALHSQDQEDWQNQIHMQTMLSQCLKNEPNGCIDYFKKLKYYEKTPKLLTILTIAHILSKEYTQAFTTISAQEELQPHTLTLIQLLCNHKESRKAAIEWITNKSSTTLNPVEKVLEHAIQRPEERHNNPTSASKFDLSNYDSISQLLIKSQQALSAKQEEI